jgi:hypothetical protein
MAENDRMGTVKQKSIKFEPWMREAIDALAERDGRDFSGEVNDLLVIQLETEGYTYGRWLAERMGRDKSEGLEARNPPAAGKSG